MGGRIKRKAAHTDRVGTKYNQEVTPMLHMRGGKNTNPDDKQTKFVEEYNKLVTKYATLKKDKDK